MIKKKKKRRKQIDDKTNIYGQRMAIIAAHGTNSSDKCPHLFVYGGETERAQGAKPSVYNKLTFRYVIADRQRRVLLVNRLEPIIVITTTNRKY